MIRLVNLTKTYKTKTLVRNVLDDITYDFVPGVNVGIIGRNGAGKSTLMNIIGGSTFPSSGYVERSSRISWPIGFSSCFHGSLTGRENLRFVCRLYGEEIPRVVASVEDFSELGSYMDMPIRTYSSGMKAKLAFGLSMAIGFDFYLVDEITAVGDAGFKQKSEKAFLEKSRNATLLVVSHSMSTIRSLCDIAGVLDKGKLYIYNTIKDAEKHYAEVCARESEF